MSLHYNTSLGSTKLLVFEINEKKLAKETCE